MKWQLFVIKGKGNPWERAGLVPGDTVLLHTSASRTLKEERMRATEFGIDPSTVTPALLLDSFLRAIGPTGTLIVPLFNFDFTQGTPFDIRSTPSHMGAMTEAARTRPDAVRTGHPIYSFAVLGQHAKRFEGLCNSSGYGSDSPFSTLMDLDGKIAVLDLDDQNSMTFYHYVEEQERVPWRYHKRFTGDYIDANGISTVRSFGIYVRDRDLGIVTAVNPMGERLWDRDVWRGDRPHTGSGLRVASARRVYEETVEVIRAGVGEDFLYAIDPNVS